VAKTLRTLSFQEKETSVWPGVVKEGCEIVVGLWEGHILIGGELVLLLFLCPLARL
jgi:hypothetical protein